MGESEWTEELKQEVIDDYIAKDPTQENTIEIVKDVANEFKKTSNGVRMVLSRANVYVKKTVGSPSKGDTSTGSKRVNKAAAIDDLKKKIAALKQDVDNDILDRLTGKAAVYIKVILDAVT